MIKKLNILLSLIISIGSACHAPFTNKPYLGKAKEIYQDLNKNSNHPFVLSVGTSVSQTYDSDNTGHPHFVRTMLQDLAQKSDNPLEFLKTPQRLWYILNALPTAHCAKCKTVFDPATLDPQKDKIVIDKILEDLSRNKSTRMLTMKKCPYVSCSGDLTEGHDKIIEFTDKQREQFIQLIKTLNLQNQKGACSKTMPLPVFRISLEAADILKDNSLEIDNAKLQKQAIMLEKTGYPLTFFHHYSNPRLAWNLFQRKEDIKWFVNYCETVLKNSPQLTHVCPISQPTAFFFRTSRQKDLPPFTCNTDTQQYFENIMTAQVEVSKRLKALKPDLKVLFSHQWKVMQPKHDITHPYYLLDRMVAAIAHKMYNGKFIAALKQNEKHFDGIALSVYPGLKFDLWKAEGENCSGIIDWQEALETIRQTHQAFPNMPIYIVETGCSTNDPAKKQEFIDMILYVCQLARKEGIDVRGVWLWSLTNDPKHYREWNKPRGSTNFGLFDTLDPKSINAGGRYVQETIQA